MESSEELRHLSALADARLEVVEDLIWALSGACGAVAWILWGWLPGLIVACATFYFVRRPYYMASNKAEDAYYRAAGLGKYAKTQSGPIT